MHTSLMVFMLLYVKNESILSCIIRSAANSEMNIIAGFRGVRVFGATGQVHEHKQPDGPATARSSAHMLSRTYTARKLSSPVHPGDSSVYQVRICPVHSRVSR